MNLNQITIYSNKSQAVADFYQKLGLRIIVDSLPRYARFECPDGDATLSVHAAEEESINSSIVLYFECDRLDEKVAELKASGFEFEQEPTDQTWLWREAYLKDPAGNRVCLFYAGTNRKDPPWKVKS